MVLELEERSRKEYVDRRNWPEYNEELVVRGTFYLNFDFAKNWDKELIFYDFLKDYGAERAR